jgi:hypothetical protein
MIEKIGGGFEKGGGRRKFAEAFSLKIE